MIRIGCVVEGHGDVEAVPVLVRRIVAIASPETEVLIRHPVRVPRDKLVKPGEIERAVDLAARGAGDHGGVLVVLDADDDCPAVLGPELLARARSARVDRVVGLVLPNREFESWFIGSAPSLAGYKGFPQGIRSSADPEAIRGAKEWINARMQTASYSETIDQPAMCHRIDIESTRSLRSFDKFYREVFSMVAQLT